MENPRIEALKKMLVARPNDGRAHFGLALEYERQEAWDEMIAHLREYLGSADDEGNAYGRLARALIRTGKEAEARQAYRDGILAAGRHGHPTLALELEEELETLES